MGASASVEDPAADHLLMGLLDNERYVPGNETLDLSREVGFEEFLAHSSAAFGGGSGVGTGITQEGRAVKSLPLRLFQNGVANLGAIKKLLLDFQALPTLEPRSKLAQLINLEHLSIRYNFLTVIPTELGALRHLQYLDLQNNSLSQFPKEIAGLPSLAVLNLANNRLESLPENLGGPKSSLRKVNVCHNFLSTLPLSLGNTPTLRVLLAVINKCQDPPQDIANKGSKALIEALRERYQLKTGQKPLPLAPFSSPSFTLPLLSEVWSHKPEPECYCSKAPLRASRLASGWKSASSLPLHVLRDKIAGCFFGSVLGDAIGVATEFMDPDQAAFFYDPPLHYRDIVKDRHRVKFQRGHFTDDSYQSLCLLQTFLEETETSPSGCFDPASAGKRIAEWAEKGFPWLGDTAGWGLGATVGKVIQHEEFATNPHAAARAVYEGSHGSALANGAVMRTGVIGIISGYDSPPMSSLSASSLSSSVSSSSPSPTTSSSSSTSSSASSTSTSSASTSTTSSSTSSTTSTTSSPDPNQPSVETKDEDSSPPLPTFKLLADTMSACKVTHWAPQCVASCLAVTTAIAAVLKGEFNPDREEEGKGGHKEAEFDRLLRHCFEVSKLYAGLDKTQEEEFWKYLSAPSWAALQLSEPRTIGYTYKAMGAAFVGLRRCVIDGQDFATVLTELTMEAGDADTNGVVMGALVGAHVGYFKLPQEWVEGLIHRAYLNCMLHQMATMLSILS